MLFYSLAIFFYDLAISLAQSVNPKARLLYSGRKNTPAVLAQFKRDRSKHLAWFHCASLGEFEQARPVIERLKRESDIQVAVSFFSPSGYEIRKNYELADVVFYLPSDSPKNAAMVLDALKPNAVFFIKYEIWVHYIHAITKRNISLYLLSATFRDNHIYFKSYGSHLKRALLCFDLIFTQDKASADLLKKHGVINVAVSNDTRYDRVYESCRNAKPLSLIETFKAQQQLLVAGSSYTEEEQMIAGILSEFPELKIVIAPHNIHPERIEEIEKRFSGVTVIRYSEATITNTKEARVLIIDNIGLLSSVYQYANIAFIGGGFGTKGIHNMLEAAAFGMPIFAGPNNHERFPETKILKEAEVLYTVRSQDEFKQLLGSFLSDQLLMKRTHIASKKLIQDNTGATDLIFERIKY
jgi:3-deoxy-D-manno-octulosonic-acid transferase